MNDERDEKGELPNYMRNLQANFIRKTSLR